MRSEEIRKRISETCKKNGVGKWRKGLAPHNKGKSPSVETRAKISASLKGRKMSYVAEANKHRTWSTETRILRSIVAKRNWESVSYRAKMSRVGKEHPNYVKENRTAYKEKCRLRKTIEWKNWRETIFIRDNYTCQECDIVGGRLEPHHIIPIRVNLETIFEIKNGITLCRPCHKKTMWKESNFEEKYKNIISQKIAAQE